MFVHAQAVEPDLVGEFELVEILVVVLPNLARFTQLVVRRSDPDAIESLRKVRRQISVRHEVEEDELQSVASTARTVMRVARRSLAGWHVRQCATETGLSSKPPRWVVSVV